MANRLRMAVEMAAPKAAKTSGLGARIARHSSVPIPMPERTMAGITRRPGGPPVKNVHMAHVDNYQLEMPEWSERAARQDRIGTPVHHLNMSPEPARVFVPDGHHRTNTIIPGSGSGRPLRPPAAGPKPPASRPSTSMSTNRAVSSVSGIGTLAGIGLGAAAGATTSWATGGNIGQGAFMGALGGGGAMYGGRMLASSLPQVAGKLPSKLSSHSSKLIDLADGLENPANRSFLFAGGGMLGGFVFGGNKSHKRGFNSKRGNSIGR